MNSQHSNDNLIKWSFLGAGKVKINTDGSSNPNYSFGSYGGLARTDQARWIEGFCGYVGNATVLTIELWGLRQGLKLAKERQWEEVEVESDSLVAVELANGNDNIANHPEKVLIEDCRRLKIGTHAVVKHIKREANRCADRMAKLGGTQTEQCVRVLNFLYHLMM